MTRLLLDQDPLLFDYADLPGFALDGEAWTPSWCVGQVRDLQPGTRVYLLDPHEAPARLVVFARGVLVEEPAHNQLRAVPGYEDLSGAYDRALSTEWSAGCDPPYLFVALDLDSVCSVDHPLALEPAALGLTAPLRCGVALSEAASATLDERWEAHVRTLEAEELAGFVSLELER